MLVMEHRVSSGLGDEVPADVPTTIGLAIIINSIVRAGHGAQNFFWPEWG